MTYNIEVMHKLYIADAKEQLDTLNNELAVYNKTRTYLLSKFAQYKYTVDTYCKISYDNLIQSTRSKSVNELDNCMFSLTSRMRNVTLEEGKRLLRQIIAANIFISRINLRKAPLIKKKHSYKVFSVFLKEFNKEILHAIMYKGYAFHLGYRCGNLLVINKKRATGLSDFKENGKVINWGESNKIKKEILARGGVPLKGDNGGEPWLVYYTDAGNCWLSWNRMKYKTDEEKIYSFTYSTIAIRELQIAKKNPDIVASYMTR